jgi:hypothetical protein
LLANLVVLFFSFSRSAWIGAALSIIVVLLVGVSQGRGRRIMLYVGVAGGVIALSLLLILHNNARFDNIIFHTQVHSVAKQSSDQGHASALRIGLHDLVHEPFGRGPGTAGPASDYNSHPARIAENFFVQIGQETGWLGLLVFITINGGVGYLLWLGRKSSLALSLLASLIGLTFVNMLSHAWADDTLAYVWWGLAGIAIATLPLDPEAHDIAYPKPGRQKAAKGTQQQDTKIISKVSRG